MRKSLPSRLILLVVVAALLPAGAQAQSFNGSIAGRVLDPAGAVVSGAELALRNVAAGVEVKRTSNDAGEYAFRNLLPGTYELRGTSTGFSPFVRKNIEVTMNSDVRLDVVLPVSGRTEEVEVVGQSVMNYDTGAHVEGIAPSTLAQLPLAVTTGRPRSSAGFAILMPGVSTGGGANPFGARLNGGMQTGDEAVLDGASMQQGHMSQGGMISLFQDFPFSPDMVSEVKVLTSSYEPQYGGSTSGQIMATTKSGTDAFHGALFLRRRPRWAGQDPRAVVEQRQELLLRGLRGLSSDRRRQHAHAHDPLASGKGRQFQRLARRQRQPDPDLRSRDDAHRERRRRPRPLPGQHHPREPLQPDRPPVAAVPSESDELGPAQQLPGPGARARHAGGGQQLLLPAFR
ncbi:MAG: hypothetical protein DMF77_22990 [Acidobacteria bacterium]|nr:MAG: hypothetical protein DMF77_22990 [Acidobacteriota bacterium]